MEAREGRSGPGRAAVDAVAQAGFHPHGIQAHVEGSGGEALGSGAFGSGWLFKKMILERCVGGERLRPIYS